MAEPITYRRIRTIVNACGKYPSEDYQSVLESLKKDKDLNIEFMTRNRETQKLTLISEHAIMGWFHSARYWELIDKDKGNLTEVGQRIHSRNFVPQFQAHLGNFVTRWEADLNSIIEIVNKFDGKDGKWPTIDNWYEAVSGMENVNIPRTRFNQLVYFLVGLGLTNRMQLTLYNSY